MKLITKALLLLSAIIGLSTGSPIESLDIIDARPFAENDPNYRLERNVLPSHYDIVLTPFLKENGTYNGIQMTEFTFHGTVKITLSAADNATNVRNIILHKNDMEILDYKLEGGVTGSVTFNSTLQPMWDSSTTKWTIPLSSDLPKAPTTTILTVNYIGNLNDDMRGFYRSYYYEKGEQVWMASTQLQQTDAPRAFPCFDEPGIKATFQLKMKRPAEITSPTLSNTRIEDSNGRETVNGKQRVIEVFQRTPRMSTYLVAFIVSNYQGSSTGDDKFSVYARPEAKNVTDMSVAFGREMLEKFGNFTGINYYDAQKDIITKMDMAAVPDFSAGAMENWGLLTYRETNILYYPNDTPSLNEQRIVAVIAHEQAHMWFGDLVTCNWWSETWLNEGFARYFQYMGTKMIKTDWDLEEQFVVENLHQSMQLDATDATHPMTDPTLVTKARASEIFDNISYNKASMVIRMLSYYLGMDVFQDTLKTYLATNREGSVVPGDLFSAISARTPGIGDSAGWWAAWTMTPGFPLVTATLANKTVTLTQERFMREKDTSKTDKYNIPITYVVDQGNYDATEPVDFFYLNSTSKSFDLAKQPEKYFIMNPKQTNFYRVTYDKSNWENIRDALKKNDHDKIHVINRAQIVDDLFNLARAGYLEYDFIIGKKTDGIIYEYLKVEKDYIPWLTAINHGLTFLSQRLASKDDIEKFEKFIEAVMTPVYDHLKFDEPTSSSKRTDIYHRAQIQSWICKYGNNKDCIAKSQEHFEKFMNSSTKVPKNQRPTVYCNAVRHGNEAHFNFLFDRFSKEDISAEQLNLLSGMSCTKNESLAKRYMERLAKSEEIRSQDRSTALSYMLNSNPEGIDFVYNYVTENHAAWKTKMGSLGALTTVANRFTTDAQFKKYEEFLSSKKSELGDSTHSSLTADKELAKKNLEWDKKYMQKFLDAVSSANVKSVSLLFAVATLITLYIFN